VRGHISGLKATHIAIESDKRGPVKIEPLPEDGAPSALPTTTGSAALVPASTGSAIPRRSAPRKARPRSVATHGNPMVGPLQTVRTQISTTRSVIFV
jgi:hypothetical protein